MTAPHGGSLPPEVIEPITAIRLSGSHRLVAEIVRTPDGKMWVNVKNVRAEAAASQRPSRNRLRIALQDYRALEAMIGQVRGAVRRAIEKRRAA